MRTAEIGPSGKVVQVEANAILVGCRVTNQGGGRENMSYGFCPNVQIADAVREGDDRAGP